MEFKVNKLKNGLTVIGEVNKSAKSSAVGFFVRTGARDENPQINGVSHFLEHMVFKGTVKLSPFEVNEAFDRTGAQYNAFTSEENTIFWAALLPEYLVEITKLWIEMMRPALRTEDFNIEKQVIKEEIAMYKDQPSYDVLDRCRTLYFGGHPCGNSVLGSVQSIEALTAEQMREYFTSRYAPNNMIAAFAGNFDWDEIRNVIETGCAAWESRDIDRKLSDTRGTRAKERLEKANLAREHICLISPSVSAQDTQRFAASLLSMIIGDSVGSRFFWELVDKAIVETASMEYSPMDGAGANFTYIRCSSENANKAMEIVGRIFAEATKAGVTENELKMAKNKVLSALVIKNELPMGRLVDLGFNWTYLRQYRTIEQDVSSIKAVAVADINALIKEYPLSEFAQFSLAPAKNG
ncbi:MAG: insulinase family protein [Sedimentisphaerales bacterium]|nr:insulinase family protein [Sedimentisphaerales bacterium]